MTRLRGIAGRIIVLFLAAAAPAVLAQVRTTPTRRASGIPAQAPATSAMSVCQARRTIVAELQRVSLGSCGGHSVCLESPPSGIVFNTGELEFQAAPNYYKKLFPRGIYRVDLKTLGEVDGQYGRLGVDGRHPIWGGAALFGTEGKARKNLSSASILGFLGWRSNDQNAPDDNAAQTVAKALNTLRLYARTFDSSRGLPPVCFAGKETQALFWAEFQKRAAAWRALPTRPPISDEVRQHRLLAEDAYQQKQFEAAAAAYEAGLEIDPLWPQGHFNAAVIYGELEDYEDAVWHMRCYLELLPNAPDVQDARDQMLLWQGKLKQQAAAQ